MIHSRDVLSGRIYTPPRSDSAPHASVRVCDLPRENSHAALYNALHAALHAPHSARIFAPPHYLFSTARGPRRLPHLPHTVVHTSSLSPFFARQSVHHSHSHTWWDLFSATPHSCAQVLAASPARRTPLRHLCTAITWICALRAQITLRASLRSTTACALFALHRDSLRIGTLSPLSDSSGFNALAHTARGYAATGRCSLPLYAYACAGRSPDLFTPYSHRWTYTRTHAAHHAKSLRLPACTHAHMPPHRHAHLLRTFYLRTAAQGFCAHGRTSLQSSCAQFSPLTRARSPLACLPSSLRTGRAGCCICAPLAPDADRIIHADCCIAFPA